MFVDNFHLAGSEPEAVAISYRDIEYTYTEMENKVQKFTSFLKSLGVKKGVKVAISSPNCPEFIFSYWAISRLGAVLYH